LPAAQRQVYLLSQYVEKSLDIRVIRFAEKLATIDLAVYNFL